MLPPLQALFLSPFLSIGFRLSLPFSQLALGSLSLSLFLNWLQALFLSPFLSIGGLVLPPLQALSLPFSNKGFILPPLQALSLSLSPSLSLSVEGLLNKASLNVKM